MKLSEVAIAHELVNRRRQWVKTYVDVGLAPIGGGFFRTSLPVLFGYGIDDRMAEAVRKAIRVELHAWIAELDEDLGKLGVEVDGIEIAIASEEERVAKEQAAKNEAAARAEALAEARAASAEKAA